MSRTIGSLLVSLGFSHKEADASIKRFEKNLRDSGKRMESIGRTMSIGFTAPFILGMRQAIKAYDEEAKVVKTLEVALGRTSTALLAQAAAIQKTTVYADDAVIKVQAYAAALGHSEAQVGKMTTAAVGLAAGLGIGLDQAMSMLHKSTMGASKGLGQLVPGVKELTKEQLKSGAAIDMVTAKFSGYAEAMAKTGTGPLEQFKNRFGDLMEQFGKAALPLLNKIIEKFDKLTAWFEKLSPATKEMVVEFGAFLALAGPVMMFTGKIISLTQSVIALSTALKGMAMAAGGVAAVVGATGMASAYMTQNYHPLGSNFGKNIGDMVMKATGTSYRSSQYGGTDMLLGSAAEQQNSGFLAPPAAKALGTATTTNGTGTAQQIFVAGQGIARALQHVTTILTPSRGNPAAGIGSIAPNLNPATAGAMGGGALTPLAGVGGHGNAIAGMMGIMPNMEPILESQAQSVDALNEGYVMLGNTLAGVMTTMAASLAEGGNAFAAFGKAALLAAASVAKAALVESLASATKKGAAVAGAPGIIIGAIAGLAAISIVEGMIGKMKTPKLAQGAVTQGITTAIIGDNPSGKEMVLPFERNDEFAASIARKMGGGGGNLSMTVHGDKLLVFLSKRQDEARRRSSGNTINF